MDSGNSDEDWRGKRSTDKGNCILCGDAPYYNYSNSRSRSARRSYWSSWNSDCGRSLCSLLSLSERSGSSFAQEFLASGPYCIQCSSFVWDINFTLVQIQTLEQRLRTLKINIEDKIRTGSERLDSDPRLKKITKELENQTKNKCQVNRIRNQASPPVPFFKPKRTKPFVNVDVDPLEVDNDISVKSETEDVGTVGWELQQLQVDSDPDWFVDNDAWIDEPPSPPQRDNCRTSKNKSKSRKSLKSGPKKRRKCETNSISKSCSSTGTQENVNPDPSQDVVDVNPDAATDDLENFPQPKPREPIVCSVCSSTFQSKLGLQRHAKREHPDHIYKCSLCGDGYRTPAALKVHEKSVHGRIFPFHCQICLQGVNTQEELAAHEQAHSSANPFACPTCQTEFTNSQDLQRHVITHVVRVFYCKVGKCKRSFASQEMLDEHTKYHSRPRTEMCDICGSCWPSQATLKNHKRAHSDEKRFRCHLCPEGFKWKISFIRHMTSIHSGERPHACRICGKSFVDKQRCKFHEETHSGTKSYVCPTCGKAFSTKPNLYQHERETHEGRRRGPKHPSRQRPPRGGRLEEKKLGISGSELPELPDSDSGASVEDAVNSILS